MHSPERRRNEPTCSLAIGNVSALKCAPIHPTNYLDSSITTEWQKGVDVEKLLYAIHTYYTILMKLLTSEIVTLFADSLLGSYLKRVEEAYYKSADEMRRELRDLEEGGIFSTIGIKNFLEADYFGWYLDEWNSGIAQSFFELTQRLLEYEPATVELNPERVKDLFKRLYQNL